MVLSKCALVAPACVNVYIYHLYILLFIIIVIIGGVHPDGAVHVRLSRARLR